MSSTRVEHQQSQSSIRRSSLVVNLSTTKKRSSVTTLVSSSRSSSSFGTPISTFSQSSSLDSGSGIGFVEQLNSAPITYEVRSQPQSAPPSLGEPFYHVHVLAAPITIGSPTTTTTTPTATTNTNTTIQLNQQPNSNMQVIALRQQQVSNSDDSSNTKQQATASNSNRRGSSSSSRSSCSRKEVSPEPIVEVKHTSSSSSLSSSNSSLNQDNSTKLVRRRTVRRYHRATELEDECSSLRDAQDSDKKRSTAELTISISKAADQQQQQQREEQQKSHFRTRQIGSYLSSSSTGKAEQKQQSSSSSTSLSTSTSTSKIAKCSITTNRKSTTSSQSRVSQKSATDSEQQQVVEELTGSSSADTMIGSRKAQPIEVREEEESSVQHHRLSSFSSSSTSLLDGGSLRKAAVSSSLASSSEAALRSRHSALMAATANEQVGSALTAQSSDIQSSSSSSRHFKTTSSSLILSGEDTFRSSNSASDAIFFSPDVQSLAKTIDTDFAELENFARGVVTFKTSRLLVSPNSVGTSHQVAAIAEQSASDHQHQHHNIQSLITPVSSAEKRRTQQHSVNFNAASSTTQQQQQQQQSSSNGDKIKELLDKAQIHARRSSSKSPTTSGAQAHNNSTTRLVQQSPGEQQAAQSAQRPTRLSLMEQVAEIEKKDAVAGTPSEKQQLHQSRCKKVMSESIERIDQRMSDLCKKLNDCQDTKEAVDLLKVMIQMIEKAWSVPVCGDDLGFKLCNSLREAGGLDIIVAFIHDSAGESLVNDDSHSYIPPTPQVIEMSPNEEVNAAANGTVIRKKSGSTNPGLWLNLSNINSSGQQPLHTQKDNTPPLQTTSSQQQQQQQQANNMKDSDSDIITSDLGLDSTSVESLSYVSVAQPAAENQVSSAVNVDNKDKQVDKDTAVQVSDEDLQTEAKIAANAPTEEEELRLHKEELIFLSARLLSQCLTSLNRNYIVENGLDPVIKLACNFTNMKSSQSQRLLSRSLIMRQSSSNNLVASASGAQNTLKTSIAKLSINANTPQNSSSSTAGAASTSATVATGAGEPVIDCSDMHAIIGTEILQHLFKHSEDTCSQIISLGGLQAILYGCRSSNIETLRHCASALANLALYGGPDSQQTMIEQKAHVWLFPLAFHEDDNIQYYACLAIVVLVANQEIEADVLKSSTLDLVEPFVTSHEPRRFAESTTSHIHGQSANWLRKLIPLLDSKRVEARNLACFHFAMEAHIKKEQGQTEVFKEIGAVEPLRKVGSSPQAIASKFACQALRLIGEKEPHKLTQQVPLWTNEDVLEWLNQIGFERFQSAFKESGVDGDLLLQLEDEMLQLDLGIVNGMIRRRFLRELFNLKRIADYSSVDKTNLCGLLNSLGEQRADFSQYIYPLVQLGVTRENVHLLDIEQLLRECRITNSIHRLKLTRALKELQDKSAIAAASSSCNSIDGDDKKTLDVFISYRRSNGSQLASLLKVHLQLRGFSVFIDVERLEAGKFDNNLLDSIKTARNFILVLSPNALDRCIGDHDCKDWVHKEIVAALANNCNIIPIMDNFLWPEAEQLPEDMRSIGYFNGVRWYHDYQDACVDKVERFIRGEIYNNQTQLSNCSAQSSLQRLPTVAGGYSSGPSVAATPSASYSRNGQPFDADHHPLSAFASHQYLQQHSAPPNSIPGMSSARRP